MYSDQVNAKIAWEQQTAGQGATSVSGCSPSRPPYTLLEEAAKSEQHHYAEAAKAGDAARFLSAHPEFDEFIRLVRSGAIRF